MYFLLAYLIIGLACTVITGRTLTAYTEGREWVKAIVYIICLYAWFSPILVWVTQAKNVLPVWAYTGFAKASYFLFGFAFLLVMALLCRDIVWGGLYFLSGKQIPDPTSYTALKYANIITCVFVLICSIYAVYAAEKLPAIIHHQYTDSRILRPVKILILSDMHITKMTPVSKVHGWVKYFNRQKPDMILLPGDIADDKVGDITKQIHELKKLKAPLGIYYTLGNHETYFDAVQWEAEFAALGWLVLHNSGVEIPETGIYVGGVPDASALATNVKQAVRQAQPDNYRILLSHQPSTVRHIQKGNVDLQVSGHTHGGQIFPFNFISKWGNNGFVSGEYKLENTVLLISNGVGYWGPPMRLGAPNDALLLELMP